MLGTSGATQDQIRDAVEMFERARLSWAELVLFVSTATDEHGQDLRDVAREFGCSVVSTSTGYDEDRAAASQALSGEYVMYVDLATSQFVDVCAEVVDHLDTTSDTDVVVAVAADERFGAGVVRLASNDHGLERCHIGPVTARAEKRIEAYRDTTARSTLVEPTLEQYRETGAIIDVLPTKRLRPLVHRDGVADELPKTNSGPDRFVNVVRESVVFARGVKHRAFVALKHARSMSNRVKNCVDDRRWAALQRKRPFVYSARGFPHTFLARASPEGEVIAAPPILWAIWFGDAPNARRQKSLDELQRQAGLELRVIRDPSEIVVPGAPFHSAFHDLHAVHKSDYVRAYLMHHYGGIYADVKRFPRSLNPVLRQLNDDAGKLVAGYREVTSEYVPDLAHELGRAIRRHYRAVMGPSGFVCRPRSQFTAEWMRELHARLDYYSGSLREADAAACDPYAAPDAYPIRWSEILGDIIQPLSMKHQCHMYFTDAIRPELAGYR